MGDAAAMRRRMRNRIIAGQLVGLGLFLVGIGCCYQGAQRGIPWLGPVAVTAIAAVHLGFSKIRKQELILLGAVTGFAFVMESVLVAAGVYSVGAETRWLFGEPFCALWLLALWTNFAVKMPSSLMFIRGHYRRAAVLGAVFGFVIFHHAESMGVLRLEWGMGSLALISGLWVAVVPAMFRLAAHLVPPPSFAKFEREEVDPVADTEHRHQTPAAVTH